MNTKKTFWLLAALGTLCGGALMVRSSDAFAQASPIALYVNQSSGSDANACTLSLPCLTLNGLLSQYKTVGVLAITVTETTGAVVAVQCTVSSTGFIITSTQTLCNLSL